MAALTPAQIAAKAAAQLLLDLAAFKAAAFKVPVIRPADPDIGGESFQYAFKAP